MQSSCFDFFYCLSSECVCVCVGVNIPIDWETAAQCELYLGGWQDVMWWYVVRTIILSLWQCDRQPGKMYQVENIGDAHGVISGPGSKSQNINQYSNISSITSALPAIAMHWTIKHWLSSLKTLTLTQFKSSNFDSCHFSKNYLSLVKL